MKIEILYPEVANLYGDLGNIRYIRASLAQAGRTLDLVETNFGGRPAFLDQPDIDLVYMGTVTESAQRLIIQELGRVKEEVRQAIEAGQRFLVTGNVLEVFGEGITDLDRELLNGASPETPALGIFPFHTERKMLHRFNSLYIGAYAPAENDDPVKIVGFKSQFTQSYYDGEIPPLFVTEKGPGFNPGVKEEGIRYKNFMATYIIGPLLVLNPWFTKELLREAGQGEVPLAHEQAAVDAYEARLKEYSEPDRGFYY